VAVPTERLTPEVQEAAGGAPELMEVAVGEASTTTGGEESTAHPEPAWRWSSAPRRFKTRSPSALRR
jgi:hypothetical protein